jgi:hypothetical protein
MTIKELAKRRLGGGIQFLEWKNAVRVRRRYSIPAGAWGEQSRERKNAASAFRPRAAWFTRRYSIPAGKKRASSYVRGKTPLATASNFQFPFEDAKTLSYHPQSVCPESVRRGERGQLGQFADLVGSIETPPLSLQVRRYWQKGTGR